MIFLHPIHSLMKRVVLHARVIDVSGVLAMSGLNFSAFSHQLYDLL
jgi:hypothetical protein